MHVAQLILPSIATLILGTAILLPLRETRRAVPDDPERPAAATEWQTALDAHAQTCESQQPPTPLQEPELAARPRPVATAHVQPGWDERIVPITRRRLRSLGEPVSWPTSNGPSSPAEDTEDRLKELRAALSDVTSAVPETVLVAACREEDEETRRLALTRLARGHYRDCTDAFLEALRNGDDEERSLAIDGLSRLGERDALSSAFNDRVDALAARAVLAYVGSRRRADFCAVLDRYVEPFRRDAILGCLAGLIE